MNRLKIFVISLPKSTDRRANVSERLTRYGLNFEFIDGIDGRTDKHPLLDRFKAGKFLARHGRPHMPGEAGCYASHFLAWEKAVELNEPIIVFEDDFFLKDIVGDAFSALPDLTKDFPFIRLEDSRKDYEKVVLARSDFRIVRFLRIPQRMTCYAITPEAARLFIKASHEFTYPVDVFLRHQNIHGVPIYGMQPAPVSPDDPSGENSVIGNRHRDKGPLWCKLTKLMFKIKNTILNIIMNIKHQMNGR